MTDNKEETMRRVLAIALWPSSHVGAPTGACTGSGLLTVGLGLMALFCVDGILSRAEADPLSDCTQSKSYSLTIAGCSQVLKRKDLSPQSRANVSKYLAAGYANRGLTSLKTGDPDKAIPDLSEAIKLRSDYAKYYYARALAYNQKQQWDRSIADGTRAIELDPDFADAYLTRAGEYAVKEDAGRALADYDRAIKLRSKMDLGKQAFAYKGRGRIYIDKDQMAKAVADLTEAIRIMERNPTLKRKFRSGSTDFYADMYYDRGRAYSGMGKHRLAAADYRQALKIYPGWDAPKTALEISERLSP
jgi:tetratricopeptide (TPR) repeat protein